MAELSALIPPADRARLVRQPLQPLTNPRLLARDIFTLGMTTVALALAGVIVWQYLLLLVPALGMLTFAVVAIHERRLSPAA